MKNFFFLFLFLPMGFLNAQSLLHSGPMVGYSDHREVAIWLQTKSASEVYFRFWEAGNAAVKRESDIQTSRKDKAFALTFKIDSLLPGKVYEYEAFINGKVLKLPYACRFKTIPLWQFRSDPPEFSFAVGSCAYINEPFWDRPGKGYGDSTLIFKTISEKKPDFMLWIGDNTYTREGDWNTRGGFHHRYSHTRSQPEMQPLLASVHHYATWDDHEYGPNDADRSFWNKQISSEAFETFWPMPNKAMGNGPVCQTFGWGDCQFFMLDDRWFRAPNADKDSSKAYLGEAQINWLLDALTFSRATFKIIACGGQVINDAAVYENYAAYPVERRRLLDRITKAGISGVLFLSGDRHHAELSRLERKSTYPLYDLTTSPLTAGIHNPGKEANTLRVEGTLFNGHNFAIIEVRGPLKSRILKINLTDNRGNVVWTREIPEAELK